MRIYRVEEIVGHLEKKMHALASISFSKMDALREHPSP
jgi:hypothetical protein